MRNLLFLLYYSYNNKMSILQLIVVVLVSLSRTLAEEDEHGMLSPLKNAAVYFTGSHTWNHVMGSAPLVNVTLKTYNNSEGEQV